MAKTDRTFNVVVVLRGLASLADIEIGIRKGTIVADIVEPRTGSSDSAVLTFSKKA